MPVKIIAFGHRQRVGKDTAAKLLFDYLKYEFPKLKLHKTSFFGPVKDVCFALFQWAGLQDAEFYENYPDKKDLPLPGLPEKTPRQIWLEFGYYLREISPHSVAKFSLSQIPVGTEVVIIPDLRDPSEIIEIRAFYPDSLVVNITRDVPPCESKLTGHPAYKLDSKLDAFTGWDAEIENNDTMRDLTGKLKNLVAQWEFLKAK